MKDLKEIEFRNCFLYALNMFYVNKRDLEFVEEENYVGPDGVQGWFNHAPTAARFLSITADCQIIRVALACAESLYNNSATDLVTAIYLDCKSAGYITQ